MRLLALVAFRDEAALLPGFFASVAPQVDGIVALDNGSIDGSPELVLGEPKLIELLNRPRRARFDDGLHRRILTEAGVRHGADWLLGLDADERPERSFGRLVRARLAEGDGSDAYALPFRELWDRPDTFRVDGIWGQKGRTALFRASADHRFDQRPLHSQWGSVSGVPFGSHQQIDARIYHLGMLSRQGRAARQARYRELDPEGRWQRIGYDYLTDERGLELRRIEPGRGYDEVIPRLGWGAHEPAGGFEPGNLPRRLIVHHTAIAKPAPADTSRAAETSYMRAVERLHLERGWAGIGYHFVIMPSGHVFEGRPLWAVGAHATGHNRGNAGIALAGDFEQDRPSAAALRSLETIRARLSAQAEPIEMVPHRELMPTACPGRFLDLGRHFR